MSGGGRAGGEPPEWSARRPVAIGIVALATLLLGLGGWAWGVRLQGALIVPGALALAEARLAVSHPDGGRLSSVSVDEGDPVVAGQELMRLDDSAVSAEIARARARRNALLARQARLQAEAGGAAEMTAGDRLKRLQRTTPGLRTLLDGQRRLFSARGRALAAEIDSQARRAAFLRQRIAGLQAGRAALERQLTITRQALADQSALQGKGLAVQATVLSLRREVARLEGALGIADADLAAARGGVAAARLAVRRAKAQFGERVLAELQDVRAQLSETETALAALERRRAALILRAPVAGVVFGLIPRAPGAVVRPAEPALFVIPRAGGLVAEARIPPARIGQVRVGQPVRLRVTGPGDAREAQAVGRVIALSADLVRGRPGESPHYRARIRIDSGDGRGGLPPGLRPGMPVELFLLTDSARPIALLTRPLRDYLGRALKDG